MDSQAPGTKAPFMVENPVFEGLDEDLDEGLPDEPGLSVHVSHEAPDQDGQVPDEEVVVEEEERQPSDNVLSMPAEERDALLKTIFPECLASRLNHDDVMGTTGDVFGFSNRIPSWKRLSENFNLRQTLVMRFLCGDSEGLGEVDARDVLGPVLGGFLVHVAEDVGSNWPAMAGSFFSISSFALGPNLTVVPSRSGPLSTFELPSLWWSWTLAPSGSNKSGVHKFFSPVLRMLEAWMNSAAYGKASGYRVVRDEETTGKKARVDVANDARERFKSSMRIRCLSSHTTWESLGEELICSFEHSVVDYKDEMFHRLELMQRGTEVSGLLQLREGGGLDRGTVTNGLWRGLDSSYFCLVSFCQPEKAMAFLRGELDSGLGNKISVTCMARTNISVRSLVDRAAAAVVDDDSDKSRSYYLVGNGEDKNDSVNKIEETYASACEWSEFLKSADCATHSVYANKEGGGKREVVHAHTLGVVVKDDKRDGWEKRDPGNGKPSLTASQRRVLRIFAQMWGYTHTRGSVESMNVHPKRLCLSPEAFRLYCKSFDWILHEVAVGMNSGHATEVGELSKGQGAILQLSLLIHCMEHCISKPCDDTPPAIVSEETVRKAISFWLFGLLQKHLLFGNRTLLAKFGKHLFRDGGGSRGTATASGTGITGLSVPVSSPNEVMKDLILPNHLDGVFDACKFAQKSRFVRDNSVRFRQSTTEMTVHFGTLTIGVFIESVKKLFKATTNGRRLFMMKDIPVLPLNSKFKIGTKSIIVSDRKPGQFNVSDIVFLLIVCSVGHVGIPRLGDLRGCVSFQSVQIVESSYEKQTVAVSGIMSSRELAASEQLTQSRKYLRLALQEYCGDGANVGRTWKYWEQYVRLGRNDPHTMIILKETAVHMNHDWSVIERGLKCVAAFVDVPTPNEMVLASTPLTNGYVSPKISRCVVDACGGTVNPVIHRRDAWKYSLSECNRVTLFRKECEACGTVYMLHGYFKDHNRKSFTPYRGSDVNEFLQTSVRGETLIHHDLLKSFEGFFMRARAGMDPFVDFVNYSRGALSRFESTEDYKLQRTNRTQQSPVEERRRRRHTDRNQLSRHRFIEGWLLWKALEMLRKVFGEEPLCVPQNVDELVAVAHPHIFRYLLRASHDHPLRCRDSNCGKAIIIDGNAKLHRMRCLHRGEDALGDPKGFHRCLGGYCSSSPVRGMNGFCSTHFGTAEGAPDTTGICTDDEGRSYVSSADSGIEEEQEMVEADISQAIYQRTRSKSQGLVELEDDMYVVQEILSARKVKSKVLVTVKWAGYEDPTEEPIENLFPEELQAAAMTILACGAITKDTKAVVNKSSISQRQRVEVLSKFAEAMKMFREAMKKKNGDTGQVHADMNIELPNDLRTRHAGSHKKRNNVGRDGKKKTKRILEIERTIRVLTTSDVGDEEDRRRVESLPELCSIRDFSHVGKGRTAGTLFAFHHCGFPFPPIELIGSESLTQVTHYLMTLFKAHQPRYEGKTGDKLFVAYDNGCHLKAFLDNPIRKESAPAMLRTLAEQTVVVVDHFHFVTHHTGKKCLLESNPYRYPDLEEVNTSIAEERFSVISSLKSVFKGMNENRMNFFLLALTDMLPRFSL
ncbi:hypothetical protein BSKO_10119 [Bryopsis sp. KO-2023]|nr:hypothetical protein BSKO_10119 [Bryopsis sp. KO-2023]